MVRDPSPQMGARDFALRLCSRHGTCALKVVQAKVLTCKVLQTKSLLAYLPVDAPKWLKLSKNQVPACRGPVRVETLARAHNSFVCTLEAAGKRNRRMEETKVRTLDGKRVRIQGWRPEEGRETGPHGSTSHCLRLLVELFKRLAIFGLPRGKSVCAPAVYNDRRRGWTGKLRILGEDKKPSFSISVPSAMSCLR